MLTHFGSFPQIDELIAFEALSTDINNQNTVYKLLTGLFLEMKELNVYVLFLLSSVCLTFFDFFLFCLLLLISFYARGAGISEGCERELGRSSPLSGNDTTYTAKASL